MREIKFRLHDKDKNLTSIFTLKELISTTYRRGKFEFRGRWTGLKDKNGKDVFEGDILRRPHFSSYGKKAGNKYITVKDIRTAQYRIINLFERFEVIGNIYENPELLERNK